jgi:hypothetical protein
MTIWETLFGTPEKAARALNEMALDTTDVCWLMDAVSEERKDKCVSCLYEYDRYGCEQKDMTLVEWLNQEVSE